MSDKNLDWSDVDGGFEPEDGPEVYAMVPVSAPPADADRADEDKEGATKVLLRQASAFAMKGTRWLYKGRIPAGMVTLLAGREGIGKSTVALDLAARLTRGTLEGRYEGKPQTVVVCATEDSWEHTIRPRLQAVDADLDLVFHIAIQDEEGHERALQVPQDTRRMAAAFRTVQPALMIVDPLMSIIDGRVDTHKQAEVQQALEPMVKMCEHLGMSVLALIHVNKSSGTDPLTNIMGSKAFATLPRSILYCLEEDQDEYMLCHAKCNVGPKQVSIKYRLASVRFDLSPEEVEDGDDPWIESSRVVWGEEDSRTATDLLQEGQDRAVMGDARSQVLALIDGATGVITMEEIRNKLDDVKPKSIENALTRMVKAQQITRVSKGVYQSTRLTPKPSTLPGETE